MKQFVVGWYVLYTRPRHEKKTTTQLAETGIDFFLPMTKELHTWHDRKKYIDTPLFPSYIFVHLKNSAEYFRGLHLEGVLHYIRTGKEIARVSEKIIDDIQMAVRFGRNIEVSTKDFKPGQQLTIRQGLLTGHSCEIVEFKGKKNILVRVNLLQRNLLVSLPSEHLTTVPREIPNAIITQR
jgi:transcriptional antiterminator RfaH